MCSPEMKEIIHRFIPKEKENLQMKPCIVIMDVDGVFTDSTANMTKALDIYPHVLADITTLHGYIPSLRSVDNTAEIIFDPFRDYGFVWKTDSWAITWPDDPYSALTTWGRLILNSVYADHGSENNPNIQQLGRILRNEDMLNLTLQAAHMKLREKLPLDPLHDDAIEALDILEFMQIMDELFIGFVTSGSGRHFVEAYKTAEKRDDFPFFLRPGSQKYKVERGFAVTPQGIPLLETQKYPLYDEVLQTRRPVLYRAYEDVILAMHKKYKLPIYSTPDMTEITDVVDDSWEQGLSLATGIRLGMDKTLFPGSENSMHTILFPSLFSHMWSRVHMSPQQIDADPRNHVIYTKSLVDLVHSLLARHNLQSQYAAYLTLRGD